MANPLPIEKLHEIRAANAEIYERENMSGYDIIKWTEEKAAPVLKLIYGT